MVDYFTNITTTLNLPKYAPDGKILPQSASVNEIIEHYKNHPSILKIKNHSKKVNHFKFNSVNPTVIRNEITSLNSHKATGPDNIPAKILKVAVDEITYSLTDLFNQTVNTCSFPTNLKKADITPVFKKDNSTTKKNYRPISILPSTSKIFERIMYRQIYDNMRNVLFPILCGFREGYSTQHALLRLTESLKACLDEKMVAGTVMMDLSKAFDCLPHDLLIAKLHAYGFSDNALQLLYSYLHNRTQRVKINSTHSEWKNITMGVPQGSVLGPLLFNIFLNDIFLFIEKSEICNYADDNTIWIKGNIIDNIIPQLESEINLLNGWFNSNSMLLNGDKCKYMVMQSNTKHSNPTQININCHPIKNSSKEKLLGVTIDSELKFDKHIKNICNEAGKRISALARLAPYMNETKRRLLMKTFITSYFNYCPLIWMFCSRKMNNLINSIHRRALRIAYNDYNSSFEALLIKDCATTIHQHNLKLLAIEMYKAKNDMSPGFMNEIFKFDTTAYDLRTEKFSSRTPKTVLYGTETITHRCNQIWNSIPNEIRMASSLEIFKAKIKQFSIPCICRLCTPYLQNLGYINQIY